MEAVMQDHFVCPLFRTPSCGINVHKNLEHVFNADPDPTCPAERPVMDVGKLGTHPILNILFPSADSFVLLSSMAATVMFQSKVPNHDLSSLKFGF
jgi:hypothetical protein